MRINDVKLERDSGELRESITAGVRVRLVLQFRLSPANEGEEGESGRLRRL